MFAYLYKICSGIVFALRPARNTIYPFFKYTNYENEIIRSCCYRTTYY
jgi:hypothetical protein